MNTHRIEKFIAAKSMRQLELSLLASRNELKQWVQNPDYRTFEIPKKKGGTRQLHAPAPPLKRIQQSINELLQILYVPTQNAYGFMLKQAGEINRNTLQNANCHLQRNFVWNLDIQNFFPSISTKRVKAIFMEGPFYMTDEIASYVALLCCYQKQIPAGAPSSPMLSHFACLQMDNSLQKFIAQAAFKPYQISYTRYADDLTFSLDLLPSDEIKNGIESIILEHGFVLNTSKNRIQHKHQGQWVTGIKVNQKPNLDRKYIRKLRAIIHHVEAKGIIAATARYLTLAEEQIKQKEISFFLNSVRGKINYVGAVRGKEDVVFKKLITTFNSAINGI
ncbi:MAG: RNA-directed DNA polymerase [Bacteroidetes bacterium]|jgi:RNA-directed DNA polymerase|nr:RNA-directed DNA polymerase [Bacteroidota bacterium]